MPAIKSSEMVNSLIDAFQDSQTPAILISSASQHPRQFMVQTPVGTSSVWIYIWTLTHGGRPALPDEYRIQMTTVASPLEMNPAGYTTLLGYEPSLKMFAGFDLKRHKTFTTGSPSVQVDIKCLHRALQDGLGFDRKDNDEIAVGIRPDQLTNYISNARDLHRFGSRTAMYELLTKAATLQTIPQNVIDELPPPRRRILQTMSKLSRDGAFCRKVLTAYGHRCAVTRMQLRLVEAAHILPVGAGNSTDDVRNGLALSPTYHRAFDNGLIFLDEDYIMRLNSQKELQLVSINQDAGLPAFRQILDKRIHLPADQGQWPAPSMIKQANRYRRIS